MRWRYVNPFWHEDRWMTSELAPEVCRTRLKKPPKDPVSVARLWYARGDAAYYKPGVRTGSLFQLHVRVDVEPGPSNTSKLRLRFSGGATSSLLLAAVMLAGVGVSVWTLLTIAVDRRWNPIYGAGLLAILVPIFLIAALRAEAPDDIDDLWSFVAGQVSGR